LCDGLLRWLLQLIALRVRSREFKELEVSACEMVILTGPSGSGKTTLLCVMGCILHPTSGAVAIFNQNVVGLSERDLPRVRRRRIGFVFQSFNLFPTLSAVENVELVFRLRGGAVAAARREAHGLLERLALGHACNALPRDLSAGQQQRVAIARALVGLPDIVLADEPTAALDSRNGRVVMDLLRHAAHSLHRAVVPREMPRASPLPAAVQVPARVGSPSPRRYARGPAAALRRGSRRAH
jgi:putative ABC transport system ATP-binding protein